MPDKKTILLIDDEKEVIQALERFFEHKGYRMFTANDGEEAILKLKEEPDLAILDMKMPKVNGMEVLKHIKKTNRTVKTIVLTGFADDYKEQAEKIGVDAFLTKPFNLENLIETIDSVLTGKEVPKEKDTAALIKDMYVAAKAAVLIYPASSIIYGNIAAQLRHVYFSGGVYEFEPAYTQEELLKKIDTFKPNIVLVDVVNFSSSKDLTKEIFSQRHIPEDLIIFGSSSDEKNQASGDKKAVGGYFDPISTTFNKEYMQRLSDALRQACIQHGLYQRQPERWDIDYEKQRDENLQRKNKEEQIQARRSNFQKMPEAINEILAKHCSINQWHIHPDTDLSKGLKIAGMALITALSDIEDYFAAEIHTEESNKFKTVSDIYRFISKIVFEKEWKGL